MFLSSALAGAGGNKRKIESWVSFQRGRHSEMQSVSITAAHSVVEYDRHGLPGGGVRCQTSDVLHRRLQTGSSRGETGITVPG
jgi:hypothetical protein